MWRSSIIFGLVAVLIFISDVPLIEGITTIHHDKPAEAKLPVMATKMKEQEKTKLSKPLNITLAPSERQKRLLPYMNFYLGYNFNQPQNQPNAQQPRQKPYKYNQIQPQNYQQYENQQILYQPKTKYTPFLESNALPGPFVPMISRPQPQKPIKVNFIQVRPQGEPTPVPNYSAIYDKLAQLKLQQGFIPDVRHNTNGQYLVETFSSAREPFKHLPIKASQPSKATIQTYTPTNIDITSNNEEIQYRQPIKQYINGPHGPIKIFLQHTIPVHESVEDEYVPPRTNNYYQNVFLSHQKPTAQDNKDFYQEPKQYIPSGKVYLQDQRLMSEAPKAITHAPKQIYQSIKPEQLSKPIYILRQKPVQYTKLQPVNYEQNQYVEKPKLVYIQPKPQEIPPPSEEHVQEYFQVTKPTALVPVPKTTTIQKLQPVLKYNPEDYQKYETATEHYQENVFHPEITTNSATYTEHDNNQLAQILKKLQDTNTLPQTLTPENIDNSIRTLVKILSTLKKHQKFDKPIVVEEETSTSSEYEDAENEAGVGLGDIPGTLSQSFPGDTPEGGTPGKPGVDYPALSTIPQTSFNCKTQRYKGFFGDPDTHCQVWHYCDLNGGQASFLCPNGTIFSQVALTCDWWFNVKCATTPQLYVLNERLYKYILPLSPKFPEDYSGPLVDRYLALKFKEMEEKMKKERKPAKDTTPDDADQLQDIDKKATEEPEYAETSTEEESEK